jgi:hypothetical protein
MNADDKAHWLKPSPPIAVDGETTLSDHGEASSSPAPSEAPEIPPSDQAAEVLPHTRRVHPVRVYARHASA